MTVAATLLFGIVSAAHRPINTEDLQTTLPIMPNLPEETEREQGGFGRGEGPGKRVGVLGGGTSCQMKAGLTFAGTNAETKVNIKRCHLISRGVPGDESSVAKR